MPPTSRSLRLRIRWWTVIVPPVLCEPCTKCTPSAVVTCSSTIRSSGSSLADRREHPLDERGLAVEDVDLVVGHLAVHAERQADRRHPLQHRHHLPDRVHAARRVGRRARRIELHRRDQPLGRGGRHVGGVGLLGEVERHQRREALPLRQRLLDPLAVGAGVRAGPDRRHQVRHHDRPGEVPRVRQHARQHRAVAQVQVPVVRAADRQLGQGAALPAAIPRPLARQAPRGQSRAACRNRIFCASRSCERSLRWSLPTSSAACTAGRAGDAVEPGLHVREAGDVLLLASPSPSPRGRSPCRRSSSRRRRTPGPASRRFSTL